MDRRGERRGLDSRAFDVVWAVFLALGERFGSGVAGLLSHSLFKSRDSSPLKHVSFQQVSFILTKVVDEGDSDGEKVTCFISNEWTWIGFVWSSLIFDREYPGSRRSKRSINRY